MESHEAEIAHLIDRAIAIGSEHYATNPLRALDVFCEEFSSTKPPAHSVALYRLCNDLRRIHGEAHALIQSIDLEDSGYIEHTVAKEDMQFWDTELLARPSGHPFDQRDEEEWRCSVVQAGWQIVQAGKMRSELQAMVEESRVVVGEAIGGTSQNES